MPMLMNRRVARRRSRPRLAVQKPRILCIDDDPDVQTSIELQMRPYNVEVEHAFYGTQGISEVHKTPPDAILMDLAMPRGDGSYLMDYLKNNQATASIPVIVLTGMRDPKLQRRLLQAGAAAYLRKPAPFDDILHQLSRFIDIRRCDEWGDADDHA